MAKSTGTNKEGNNTSLANKVLAVSIVVAVAVVGYAFIASRALGPFAIAEAEKGTVGGTAKVIDDTTAAGGKAVQFGPVPVTPPPPSAAVPNGPTGTWNLKFSDEFAGAAVDTKKWTDESSAEYDGGHGNIKENGELNNQQLEYNRMANCTVTNGELSLTARRQAFTSPSGTKYTWTSCLLSSTPGYAFRYGYIEERSMLPANGGFWPAFWTWQAPGVNQWNETDVYEYFTDNHTRLYLSQHSGTGGSCDYVPPFDPSAGYHTYGADIQSTGTVFYIDGKKVCTASGSHQANTNIITNLSVYSQLAPPTSTTTAVKKVDYIRAWQR
ncbi:MAG TPA: glycoside hydrolase family 16 protein [Nevskiaceae bacterium]|nr:glycoside hydrolase family 16 protein [Nevskiaceae bacterium]